MKRINGGGVIGESQIAGKGQCQDSNWSFGSVNLLE